MRKVLRRIGIVTAALAGLSLAAPGAFAQMPSTTSGYHPAVPVSAFALPSGWFDSSRFHVASTVSFGSGFTSGATSGLQVTSLSYQFARPAWLEVSVGNSFGSGNFGGNGMFLEGLRFGFRPTANTIFQVQFQDVRSPLQLTGNPYSAFTPYSPYRR